MRYEVIVLDSQDIDSENGPESALIEDDKLEVCEIVLHDYLQNYETVYAYRIIDTLNNCVVRSWHK